MMLLDEGTAHLNDALQQRILKHITGTGITVIPVTHHDGVLRRADRTALTPRCWLHLSLPEGKGGVGQ